MTSSTSLYSGTPGNANVASKNFTTLYSGQGAINPQQAYGNANVVSLLAAGTDGGNTVGNIIAAGNVTADYFIGNFLGNITGNITVTGSNTEVLFNNAGNVGAAPGLTFNSASNVLATSGSVTATGNVTGGNILTAGQVSATGNVTGNYILGNGSQLTGLPATYGNANVVTLLAAFGSNTVSTTGNVTAGYFIGNGSQLTGLPASYSNANVASFMATFGSNTISSTGNITTTANISGGYILGNGSQLTGLPAGYSNAQVSAYLASGTNTANIITTGNVQGGNILSNGLVNAGGNITTTASIIQSGFGGGITAVGNITTGTNVNAQIVSAIGNVLGGNITTGGNVSAAGNVNGANLYMTNDATILGNLTVNGNTTFINSNVVTINDKFINVANNAASAAAANGGGLGVGPVGTEYATLSYDSTGNIWTTNIGLSVTGNVTGNVFTGNGAGLTNINAANIINAYGNANVADFLANGFGSNTVSTTGNITSGNLLTPGQMSATGNVSGGNVILPTSGKIRGDFSSSPAGGRTVLQTTNTGTTAQTTLTAIPGPNHVAAAGTFGAATGLFSSNDFSNVSIFGMYSYPQEAQIRSTNLGTGNVNDVTFRFGSGLTLGATVTQTGIVSAVGNVVGANLSTTGQVSATGNITGAYHIGDGSLLSNITAANVTGTVGLAQYVTANAQANITSVGTLTSLSVSGNTTSGNLITAGTVSASAATANVLLSNIRITSQATNSGQQYTAVNARDVSVATDTGRMLFGNGFQGNVSTGVDFGSRQAKARFGFWDTVQVPNNYAAGAINMTSTGQFQLTGNTNAAARLLSTVNFNMIASEGTANTFTSTGTVPAAAAGFNCIVNAGNWTNNTTGGMANVGNVIINTAAGGVFGTVTNGGSTIGNSFGVVATNQSTALPGQTATNNNQIYFSPWDSIAAAGTVTTPGNVFAYYNPGTTNSYGVTHASQMRASANYYFLRNDDDVAQSKLGSLRTYHEFQYSTATSGTVNIDKTNAQVQFINPTANVTIGSYLNFVTTANDGTNNDNQADTVTLVIQQGTTPYTVTMPTGNASIKYSGNVTTVGSTANAVTMVSITAFRSAANATMYLTTISPEFV